MITVREVIDAFDRQQFDAVEQFLQNVAANRSGNSVVTNPSNPETKQTKIDKAFPWIHDIGVGPISDGIGALQIMSDVIAGARWGAFKIFNRYNVIYSPEELKKADDRLALIIILTNLGMLDYYNIAKDIDAVESNKLKDLCLKIHKRIKAGAFQKDQFEKQLLIACKSVIRVTINYRQVI